MQSRQYYTDGGCGGSPLAVADFCTIEADYAGLKILNTSKHISESPEIKYMELRMYGNKKNKKNNTYM